MSGSASRPARFLRLRRTRLFWLEPQVDVYFISQFSSLLLSEAVLVLVIERHTIAVAIFEHDKLGVDCLAMRADQVSESPVRHDTNVGYENEHRRKRLSTSTIASWAQRGLRPKPNRPKNEDRGLKG